MEDEWPPQVSTTPTAPIIADLRVHVLHLVAMASEPIALDSQPASAMRGALFHSLLRRFCMNPEVRTCSECPLNATCPVAGLVAPLRDEHPRGRDVPRPFVLAVKAPDGAGRAVVGTTSSGTQLAPGDTFEVRMSLLGRAIGFLPYIALSLPLLESGGIGRPLQANGGRRGRFRVERMELVDPFDALGERTQRLFTRGESRVAAPGLAITGQDVAARAAELGQDGVTLEFLTPTRLTAEGKLVHHPEFLVLVLRLAERLEAITREYGLPEANADVAAAGAEGARALTGREWYLHLGAQAERVRLVSDQTRWVDVASYSARQGRATPIGGFVGPVRYEGELTPELRELLVWGELLHVGKNAVKGDGRYRIQVGARSK